LSGAAVQRLSALDSQRGLIMIFMALDHASMFVANQHFAEFWGVPLPDYGDVLSLFTRVISHLCAPGFFFSMGIGMHLFAESRRSQQWPEGRIIRHFAIRGAVLIAADIFIVTPAWVLGSVEAFLSEEGLIAETVPGIGGTVLFGVGVLAALGVAMILSAFFLRASGKVVCALGLLVIIACQALLPDADRASDPMPIAARLLLVAGQDGFLLVIYPILPWFGVCLTGVAYGHALKRDPDIALRRLLPAGVIVLTLFVVVRGVGGFGNHHPAVAADWMSFLTLTKYPPSIAFLLLSLGTNALLLWLLANKVAVNGRINRVLNGFGRAPLFFYIVHLYLYAIMGLCIPGATSLPGMYLVWVIGLMALLPVCRRYDGFKRGKEATSIWRLF
jgi:uncharacterized membrane protein